MIKSRIVKPPLIQVGCQFSISILFLHGEQTYTERGIRAGNTNALVHIRDIVANKTVAALLREQPKAGQQQKPVPVSAGLKEVQVAAHLLGLESQAERLLDLVKFELDRGIVVVSVGVVLAEDIVGI